MCACLYTASQCKIRKIIYWVKVTKASKALGYSRGEGVWGGQEESAGGDGDSESHMSLEKQQIKFKQGLAHINLDVIQMALRSH